VIKRGMTVLTEGPWSAGHTQQCAIVTHVYGEGDETGVLVNLYVFIDQSNPMIFTEIPFYRTRLEGLAAQTQHGAANFGAKFCYLDSE
jgi:hypothetical protein